MNIIGLSLLTVVPLGLLGLLVLKVYSRNDGEFLKALVRGFLAVNAMILLIALVGLAFSFLSPAVRAAPSAQEAVARPPLSDMVALAAALSTGLATISAGIAVGMTGSAALGTIAERPETFGRALILVGLAEGIAIYGLIVSFLIISR